MQPADDITIRPAARDDVPAIAALLAEDPLGRAREDPGDLAVYLRAFDDVRAQPGNLLAVAERAGAVVGCLQLTIIPGLSRCGVKRALIEGVRVGAGERGRGLGERLLRHAIGLARAEGCGLVQLTSDKSRRDAHRFYERLGFVASHVGLKLELG
ncbi:MAG: GNAT family N-acetyltransferase [Alphaproteobacteria bacterium]|nr:GNAT family N-acetyltransferase [Alphaproteobacteria bacterium]MBV9553241.1 GNAT family N-acetyltransferase [Alphaproteobacteria bacterium]